MVIVGRVDHEDAREVAAGRLNLSGAQDESLEPCGMQRLATWRKRPLPQVRDDLVSVKEWMSHEKTDSSKVQGS